LEVRFDDWKDGTDKRKRKPRKRVHIVRNPFVCSKCWTRWAEKDLEGNKSVPQLQKRNDGTFYHKPCKTLLMRYYEIPAADLAKFAKEKLFTDPKFLNFFPSMANLIREDMPATDHHNTQCEGSCCMHDQEDSMGPEPNETADVEFHVNDCIFFGWIEQSHKTCAAASVAGALNAVLNHPSFEGRLSPADDKLQVYVQEKDVIEYYCKWAREAGRISCHAALRGSCGLIPSTRKIGNPRLLRACHAVSKSLCVQTKEVEDTAGVKCPPLLKRMGNEIVNCEDEDSDDASDDSSDSMSPVETARLLGNWNCREEIVEGGRCSPNDDEEVEVKQWEMVKEELNAGHSLLIHFRNHYSLIFATREWFCHASSSTRRQVLTATQKQRPHVWFCFRQLRADIVYSKVNQLIVIRPSIEKCLETRFKRSSRAAEEARTNVKDPVGGQRLNRFNSLIC